MSYPIHHFAGAVLGALATLSVAAPMWAQGAPKSTAQQTGSRVLIPSLKGVVFVPDKGSLKASGISTPGIQTTAVKMLDSEEFRASLQSRLDHPLTLDTLNEITHSVITYYRDHNHPLVDATVPAQNVESGVVQVVVTEFRVGEVRARGNKWFSDRIVTAPLGFQHGDEVDSAKLVNQLDAANTNPFRRVNLLYQPSSQTGYTDLVLDTQDRLPLSVFSGFDNSGTPITGRNRWETGITWGNAFGHDQQLSYQFSSSTDLFGGRSSQPGQPGGASFAGHSLTWSMPVFGRDSISILGGFQRSVPNLGSDFGLVGLSGQAGVRYSHALRRTGSLIHTVQFGYDFKTTNNNLGFGGTQVSRSNTEIDQFPVAYAANLTDRLGSLALTTSVFFSPGGLTPNNTDSAFRPGTAQSGRELASARYTYWRSDLTRLTKLPENAVWAVRVLGQVSSANLLYTEQLAGGGVDILRGYDPNSILGDTGIIISNELRSPAFHNTEQTWVGNVQVLGFWDWANLNSVHDAVGVLNHISASSAGAGLRYNIRSNLTGRLDYGWQLQHIPTTGDRDHLLNFSLILAY